MLCEYCVLQITKPYVILFSVQLLRTSCKVNKLSSTSNSSVFTERLGSHKRGVSTAWHRPKKCSAYLRKKDTCCIFKTWCTNAVFFPHKCLVYHNFILSFFLGGGGVSVIFKFYTRSAPKFNFPLPFLKG